MDAFYCVHRYGLCGQQPGADIRPPRYHVPVYRAAGSHGVYTDSIGSHLFKRNLSGFKRPSVLHLQSLKAFTRNRPVGSADGGVRLLAFPGGVGQQRASDAIF